MSVTLSRNLKLKIDSNLTANAKYNLERIDSLGAIYFNDNTENVQIRSIGSITFLPNNASTGGSGVGGVIAFGSASQPLSSFTAYVSSFDIDGTLGLKDAATGGTRFLSLQYKSDINGSTDIAANRTLNIDLDGADRNLTLGAAMSVQGGAITLTGPSNLVLPVSGTAATLAGTEVLTNKSIDASNNTISNLSDSNFGVGATIGYSRLVLLNSIVNSDINSSAAIAYSKLNLAGNVVNNDISASAGITYSKLALTSSILNADISPSAAITYSKLSLVDSIVDSDVNNSAAIAGSKILAQFGNQVLSTSDRLRLVGPSFYTDILPHQSAQLSNLQFTLPETAGAPTQVLATDGNGNLSWQNAGGAGAGQEMTASWVTADGAVKTIVHNFGTRAVEVEILDINNSYETLLVDTIQRSTNNTLTLTASEAPVGSGWLVLLKEITG